VDCRTDDPVAGDVAGKVYTVLPEADETNAVKFAPLNICNLPPIETDFAIPAPPETANEPVVVEEESSVELNVALPVEAPTDNIVAAPNAFIVVAVVLKTLKDPLSVVTLVVNTGDVEKTNLPAVPVSSLIIEARAALVVITEAVPPLYCKSPVALLLFKPVPP
jgi:hypothetical protein